MSALLLAEGLRKSFPDKKGTVAAVQGVDLRVEAGQIYGFLGPNGAGKTTVLRMLTTLLPIDGGKALIAGIDVTQNPAAVRRRIGYVGQAGGADLPATGRENLLLHGQLYGATRALAARRAEELIETLSLAEFADRTARTYSGGQRRRLEIALGLMQRPELLFLDEPTTGLDPQNRANLWHQLRMLREAGTTIFLTTHYLEEADALADRLAIIDRGRIVSEGRPMELKQQIAGETVTFETRLDPGQIKELSSSLAALSFVRQVQLDGGTVKLTIVGAAHRLAALIEELQSRHVVIEALSLSQPSLDDVFLAKTGRALRDESQRPVDESRAA